MEKLIAGSRCVTYFHVHDVSRVFFSVNVKIRDFYVNTRYSRYVTARDIFLVKF